MDLFYNHLVVVFAKIKKNDIIKYSGGFVNESLMDLLFPSNMK